MNQQLRCAHCRCRFVPNPRVKTQRFCSAKPCQQARKTQWQRQKIATDPDYQADQRDGQSAWRKRHRDYWRQYRQEHPAYRERNRLLGYPRKAGQFGVGHVLYGTKFNHEFSHPAEDRPTWDIGPKAA